MVVGGTDATNVPLAQPMIPANNNYGYGQPIYYANQPQPGQYAAPSGIPDAQPSGYPSYQPYNQYAGQQQYPQPMVLPTNQPYEYGKQL